MSPSRRKLAGPKSTDAEARPEQSKHLHFELGN